MRSYLKSKSSHYQYRKRRKFLFWVWEEGFYYTLTMGRPYLVSKEFIEIESGGKLYCEGEDVYYKPHIEIRMRNSQYHEVYFESEAKLNEFINSPEMKQVNWVDKSL
ncbi:MAG: hypothetical protein AABY15_02275 [Nanoarchaeota archaeon]